jgi:hypothetical protein
MNKIFGYRLIDHIFDVAVLIVFAMVGLAFLIDPEAAVLRSPIGHVVGSYGYVWSILYLLALPTGLYGLYKRAVNIRVCALLLFLTGISMQATASLAFPPIEIRDFTYLIWALAAIGRAVFLFKISCRRS